MFKNKKQTYKENLSSLKVVSLLGNTNSGLAKCMLNKNSLKLLPITSFSFNNLIKNLNRREMMTRFTFLQNNFSNSEITFKVDIRFTS